MIDLGLGDFSVIQSNFRYHNNMKFSTMDVDNDDGTNRDCSSEFGNAGWWFKSCQHTNLNGRFGADQSSAGIIWRRITLTSDTNLRSSRILVRKM